MSQSIFSKVYSYREKENKDSKENFLIEIFAHCLQVDKKFRKDFLGSLKLQGDANTTIKTQAIYEFGRPDIEINIPTTKTCILIECKIEQFERPNQLQDYKKILRSKKISKRYLVYLTKYYDFRDNDDKKINFLLIKWFDVYQLIDENNSQITQELKSYLIDENMDESKNFNYTDLSTLMNIAGIIRKMDEVIDSTKEYYKRKIGSYSKESSRSTRLQNQYYVAYQHFSLKFSISVGFMWDWGNEQIYLGTRIWLPRKRSNYKNTPAYFKLFKRYLKDWETENENNENDYIIGRYKSVGEFILDDEKEQVPAMVGFLRTCIDQLEALKRIDPKIFD